MSFLMKLTSVGAAKIAAANAGDPIELTEMAAGDGDGAAVALPTGTETELVNEVWRGGLTSLSVSVSDPQVMIAEAVVPIAVGPFTVREIGVFDVDGDLIAYGNFPETYKPAPIEGSARELLIRASLRVATTDNVTILIDESAIFATQAWSNGRFLQIAANLADVDDPEEARANLGAAPLSSPVFINNPRAPTPEPGDNDTSLATTAFVKQFFDNLDMTALSEELALSGGAFTFNNIPQGFRHLFLELVGVRVTGATFTNIALDLSTNGSDWTNDSGSLKINAATSDVLHGGVVIFGYRRRAGLFLSGLINAPSNLAQASANSGALPTWRVDDGIDHMRLRLTSGGNPGPTFNDGIGRLWGF